jgi:hypothetical protein
MGIDTLWKEVIRDNTNCFIEEIPGVPEVVIIDSTVKLYSHFYKAFSGGNARPRMMKDIFENIFPGIQSLCLLLDEHEYTPRCKLSEKKTPYTDEEVISEGLRVTDGQLPELKKMMDTPLLREDAIRFYCQVLKECLDGNRITQDITIDGYRSRSRLQTRNVNQEKSYPATYSKFVRLGGSSILSEVHEDSKKIGESDLKIVHHVNNYLNKFILVKTVDTDIIPIILLNMRHWINSVTSKLELKLFVDFGSHAKAGTRYLDVVRLYRTIIIKMKPMINFIPLPIETMVILMLISGSDYSDNLNVKPKVIWQTFFDKGYRCLEQELLVIFTIGGQIAQPQVRSYITIAEHLIANFVTKCGGRPIRGCNSYIPSTRRLFWNMDYWINGGYKGYEDPLKVNKQTGLSEFGWCEKNGKVIITDKVQKYDTRFKT